MIVPISPHPCPDPAAHPGGAAGAAASAAGPGAAGEPGVDWDALHALAVAAMRTAYVPYSGYPVGVAGLTDDGRLVSGCNVENASLGVTLCAECGMVSELARTGGGRLRAVYCVDAEGKPLVPCGRCRQLLWEHGGARMLLVLDDGVHELAEILPRAFGPDHLAEAAERRAAKAAQYLADNP